jgi:GST-like protein
MQPIQLYSSPVPNAQKVSIMLEETELPYQVHAIDLYKGEQRSPDFLAINPSGKVPAITDPDRGLTITESGAILFYLADRSGRIKPADEEERAKVLQWSFFQAAHVGATMSQLWHFKRFAPEIVPYAVARFEEEARRIFGLLDARLATNPFIAGDRFGIADIMTFPSLRSAPQLGFEFDSWPQLTRWLGEVAARPGVQRGLSVPKAAPAADEI